MDIIACDNVHKCFLFDGILSLLPVRKAKGSNMSVSRRSASFSHPNRSQFSARGCEHVDDWFGGCSLYSLYLRIISNQRWRESMPKINFIPFFSRQIKRRINWPFFAPEWNYKHGIGSRQIGKLILWQRGLVFLATVATEADLARNIASRIVTKRTFVFPQAAPPNTKFPCWSEGAVFGGDVDSLGQYWPFPVGFFFQKLYWLDLSASSCPPRLQPTVPLVYRLFREETESQKEQIWNTFPSCFCCHQEGTSLSFHSVRSRGGSRISQNCL